METEQRYFTWGCSVSIDPISRFPTEATISHVRTCQCPDSDRNGVIMVILEQAHYLHLSNVVKYMIPIVNHIAQDAALRIGINLDKGIEDLSIYEDKVWWTEDGVCVEVLGRGFTEEELEELSKLPRGQTLCSWLL
ncbi:hypothetical protein GGS21DRAFT_35939 [Xylaria nigripes]|nr:hypothetical protein GGS21DRAFT_35939 [Xylaria nigripes]